MTGERTVVSPGRACYPSFSFVHGTPTTVAPRPTSIGFPSLSDRTWATGLQGGFCGSCRWYGAGPARPPVVRNTIPPIRATGVLALSGKDGRMALIRESSRRGTGRRMLAMPISCGFGASRLSGQEASHSKKFETNHLLLREVCCRSFWGFRQTKDETNATNGFVSV